MPTKKKINHFWIELKGRTNKTFIFNIQVTKKNLKEFEKNFNCKGTPNPEYIGIFRMNECGGC